MKKAIRIVAIAIPIGAALLIAASRQIAIAHGDAFMRAHLQEDWVRLRCSPVLLTADKWTPLWDVVYETDTLTGTPPAVRVSLWGSIKGTNLRIENQDTE